MADENTLVEDPTQGTLTFQPADEPVETPAEPGTVEEPKVDEPPEPPDDYSEKVQKRIDKEVARRKREEERRIRAETRAEMLEDQLREGKPPEVTEPSKPKVEDFDDYDDFIDAKVAWEVARQKDEWLKEAESRIGGPKAPTPDEIRAKINEGVEKYGEDFADIWSDPTLPINETMRDSIMESDMLVDLVQYLGTHRNDAIAIHRMNPMQAARAIGQLEERLKTAQAQNPNKPNVSNAPPPINPVTGPSGPVAKDPEKMSMEEFRRWRTGK